MILYMFGITGSMVQGGFPERIAVIMEVIYINCHFTMCSENSVFSLFGV